MKSASFWQRHWQKIIAVAFWLILIGVYLWYTQRYDLSPVETAQQLIDVLKSPFGFVIYILVYMLRPIIFFPATILTLLGGNVFGAVFGVLFTVIGANASAMVAYLIGYFFSDNVPINQNDSRISGYIQRMRDNSFETIMTLRFLFAPYDLVNYVAGIVKIRWKPFLLATVLGSLPGTITFVLLGASIKGDLANAEVKLNPWALTASAVIFGLSIGLSRYLKRREQQ